MGNNCITGLPGLLENMALPTVSTSALTWDTGSELGITLYRQPPLPPPHSPGTYPPKQIRKWWISKSDIDSCSLEGAIREIKQLFACENWYTLLYYDGLHLMPIVTDKDLRCALSFFLANASTPRVCSLYRTEVKGQDVSPGDGISSRSQISTSKKYASSVRQVRALIRSGSADTAKDVEQEKEAADRLARFNAKVLAKHGGKAEVESETVIRCLHHSSTIQVMCKKYNQ